MTEKIWIVQGAPRLRLTPDQDNEVWTICACKTQADAALYCDYLDDKWAEFSKKWPKDIRMKDNTREIEQAILQDIEASPDPRGFHGLLGAEYGIMELEIRTAERLT